MAKEVKFKRCESFEELTEPGDGYWNGIDPKQLTFLCPCGCGAYAGIKVVGEGCWDWNGDLDKPTANPSILINGRGAGCGWHGYLTDGVFRSC